MTTHTAILTHDMLMLMIYVLLALIPFTVFMLAARYANQRIDPVVSVLIVNLLSFLIPAIIAVITKTKLKIAHSPKDGIAVAILAGAGISAYSYLMAKAMSTTNVAIVSPILWGGVIVTSTIGAAVLFHEKINTMQIVGLALVVVGIGLVIVSKARA